MFFPLLASGDVYYIGSGEISTSFLLFIVWLVLTFFIMKAKDKFIVGILFLMLVPLSLTMFNDVTVFDIPIFIQISFGISGIAFYRLWKGK